MRRTESPLSVTGRRWIAQCGDSGLQFRLNFFIKTLLCMGFIFVLYSKYQLRLIIMLRENISLGWFDKLELRSLMADIFLAKNRC